ncbi:MAG TPA: hypothetical protein VHN15_03635 [Thermoanaerobaculia bacterium]|nr:hypothetical protein [Thermoanaerobaculia bacterium]
MSWERATITKPNSPASSLRVTRILRAVTGMSQGQFARSAGLSRNRLAHIEADD